MGLWGKRRLDYLKKYKRSTYLAMLNDGTLEEYIAEVNDSAYKEVDLIIRNMAEKDVTDEKLKVSDPMKWVGLMNNYKACAEEVVYAELIYV